MATITLPQEVARAVALEKLRSASISKALTKEIDTLKKGIRELQASGKSMKQSIEEKERDLHRQLKSLTT